MSEKPILFNTEMVKAILEGRKTQTRRVIKPQPKGKIFQGFVVEGFPKKHIGYATFGDVKYVDSEHVKPPYRAGDVLWVRETWCELYELDEYDRYIDGTEKYYYRANKDEFRFLRDDGYFYDEPLWKPSIHMPKKAARIFLKVTNVRVERLQEITKEDYLKEGLPKHKHDNSSIQYYFKPLWDRTVKKQDISTYGWDSNPWVWVISFERVVYG